MAEEKMYPKKMMCRCGNAMASVQSSLSDLENIAFLVATNKKPKELNHEYDELIEMTEDLEGDFNDMTKNCDTDMTSVIEPVKEIRKMLQEDRGKIISMDRLKQMDEVYKKINLGYVKYLESCL